MKRHYFIVPAMLTLCISCINNPLDSKQDEQLKNGSPLRSLLSKSGSTIQEDSLTIMSNIQKDIDHLMMNRIVFKDSIYILAIKRQDAIFLGVPEAVYDRYIEYVAGLNQQENN